MVAVLEHKDQELAELPTGDGHADNDNRSLAPMPANSQAPITNKRLFVLVMALGLASAAWLIVDAGMRYGFSNPWAWQL